MNNNNIKRLMGALALATGVSLNVLAAESCQTLVWSDEFNGSSVDFSGNWEAMIGNGCEYNICGWGNNELQYYKAENATVSNGILSITAKKERVRGNSYTSARLRTANMPTSGEWTHGRFEARIKLPVGQGLWPAFWMLPTNPDVGWPVSGEIDIIEATGQAPMIAHGTIHYGDPYPNNRYSTAKIFKQPDNWSDDFHEYAIEWSPNEMRWYIDDHLYAVKTPQDLENSAWWTFENYQYHILLNLAVGGTWGGTPDDSIFPVSMEVDYVRVYNLGQPSVKGPHIVGPNEVATFEVVDENGSTSNYNWSTTNGATVQQNGRFATVDFSNATSGNITVEVNNSCGTHQLVMPVFVEPNHGVETMLDDYQTQRQLTYTYYDGAFVESGGVLNYTRSATTQWDVIAADFNLGDAGPLVSGEKAFVMDFNNTDPALVGKEILIQLENNATATPDNYPGGRHSKYQAFIEHANGWQTLRFRIIDRPDSQTSDTQVTSLIILIDPNSFNGDSYVIDNIGILGAGGGSNETATITKVAAVVTGTQDAGQGKKFGTASVTVTDNTGAGIAGALVSGTFSGTWSESVQATTDANGVAQFQTSTAQKGGVNVNFCVSNVENTILPFDASQSTGMCQ